MVLVGSASAGNDRAWRLGVHPFVSATELLERFRPLADYLAETTGERFEVRVSHSYDEHIAAVAQGRVDLAYMGPAIYARLWNEHGKHEVLAREEVEGRDTFRGHLIVRDEKDIHGLEDIAGHTVAFVNKRSTMGYWMPRRRLAEAGIELADLGGHLFLNDHFNVASAVLLGDVDVGAVREEVYRMFAERGVRSIGRTEPVPQHPLVVRRGLEPQRLAVWRDALLALNEIPEGEAVLEALGQGVTGMSPAKAADYSPLREILETEQ
ncbi:MAG: phosphate/phosphite/phosphonate ABC transporter substrate-binding protein [Pseudomonadota bacterium]